MTSPRHPTAAFWITAALLAVLVAYPLSFGPTCWWFSPRVNPTADSVDAPAIYLPIGRLYLSVEHDGWISRTIRWYATIRHQGVQVRYDADVNARVEIDRDY